MKNTQHLGQSISLGVLFVIGCAGIVSLMVIGSRVF